MATLTIEQVDYQMRKVADDIVSIQSSLAKAKKNVSDLNAQLNNIPNTYADLVETVNAATYGTGTYAASELVTKSKLSALTASFSSLITQATAAKTWLDANITRF